jgi:hypothetical protein
MPKINFDGIKEFTVIPEGTYQAALSGTKLVAEARTSKQPYVELSFTISEGEHTGRRQFRNYSLQPQALWAFKQTMVRLGADPDEFTGELDLNDIAEITANYVGSPCQLDVGQREYNGELRNEVKAVLAPLY